MTYILTYIDIHMMFYTAPVSSACPSSRLARSRAEATSWPSSLPTRSCQMTFGRRGAQAEFDLVHDRDILRVYTRYILPPPLRYISPSTWDRGVGTDMP